MMDLLLVLFALDEQFETKIRPVLVERCYECHSAQAKKLKGDLRLDTRDGILKARGLILTALRGEGESPRMPPAPKARLTDRQIADFEEWIRRGAPPPSDAPRKIDPEWEARKKWIFEPPADPPGTTIDAFIIAKLEERGLLPAPAASKRELIRRATFDLIGLPPTPEEVDAFLADEASGAFAKVVDRLLASPHYGERWGRHWLDLARYALVREDSAEKANQPSEIPEAWRYRNWVIDAFNRDLPYDQFIVHQVAGDLLPPAEPGTVNVDGIIASGFLAIGEWGIQDDNPEKMVWDTADEQIDAVSRTFMGLTMACARCHDHKFDPLTTADYYGLAGIFTSTHVVSAPAKIGVHTPMARIPLVPPAEVEKHKFQTARNAESEKRLAAARDAAYRDLDLAPDAPRDDAFYLSEEQFAPLARIKSEIVPLAPLPVAVGAQEGGIPGTAYAGFADARIRIRGDYLRAGDLVPRRFPSILSRQTLATAGSGRWQLAGWLASPQHPLTARVMVNRIWQHHFGRGIVATPSSFGKLGEPPTHPELLDWLARRFVEQKWSVKAMHRLILLSDAYQRSSRPSREGMEKDPDNRLVGRMSRRRLEAEAFRDSLLAVTGELDRGKAGPAEPDSSRKRMIYLRVSRTSRTSFEALFDGADATAHTDRRTISTVAPQALFLLNNTFVPERAAALARRLTAKEPAARVNQAYELLYGRPAAPVEIEIGLTFADDWVTYARVLLCANEFVCID